MKKTNTSNIEMHHANILLAGSSGAGKTYTALTLPPSETLIISAESGLLTLKGSGHEVWELKTYEDLRELFAELHKGVKFKNIFVDSLSELSDIIMDTIRPQFSKSQTYGLYEEYSRRMITFIKGIRDMNRYNFILTSLIKESNNGMIIDVAQKSLGEKIPAYFDFVFLVKALQTEKGVKRALISDNSIMDFCKSRSNRVDPYEQVDLNNIINKVLKQEVNNG